MVTILKPFYRYTLELEGHHGNGAPYDLLPAMDFLCEHLESAKSLYSGSSVHVVSSIELA